MQDYDAYIFMRSWATPRRGNHREGNQCCYGADLRHYSGGAACFTSRTYMEVPVMIMTLGAAAILNKGSNFMFGEISLPLRTPLRLYCSLRLSDRLCDYPMPQIYGGRESRRADGCRCCGALQGQFPINFRQLFDSTLSGLGRAMAFIALSDWSGYEYGAD